MLLKSPKRYRTFHAQCPGIREPPPPTLTRWGTWLQADFYYAEHFQKATAVILQFNPAEAAAIKESRSKFQDTSVEIDLQSIHSYYKYLHDALE